jgi:DNA polymerase-3 subunit delta'
MPSDLLSRVRSQETALRTLEVALESGRIHHAYLFVGPDGVGKELAAFGLAQALVCEKRGVAEPPSLFGAAEPPKPTACGSCSACVRAVPREDSRRPIHPDVVVLERGLYTPQQLGRRAQESQDISIDQIRTLVLSRAAYAPHEGRAKVFVVRRAEELSTGAANALLKTLEEPGDRTHFILITSQPEALLPTILSRTQRIRFAPLPDETLLELLAAQGVEHDRAVAIARMSGGSFEQACVLADPEESQSRDEFVSAALAAVAGASLLDVLALAESAKKDKEKLATNLAALSAALASRANEAARAGLPEAETLALRGRHALSAIDHLAGNGAPQLVVEAMLTRMRSI